MESKCYKSFTKPTICFICSYCIIACCRVCWLFNSEKNIRCSQTRSIRPDGVCLGLQRFGINIWWQVKGGMIWLDMYKKFKTLLKFNDKPHYLFLHCGDNDVGSTFLKSLIQIIKTSEGNLQLLLHSAKILWSQLLPRRQWRYSLNP